MKQRIVVIVIIVVLITAGGVLLWRAMHRTESFAPPRRSQREQITSTRESNSSIPINQVAAEQSNRMTVVEQTYEAYRQGAVDKIDVMRKLWESENEKRLIFYGKLVDQRGQPVPDAKVVGSTMIIAGIDSTRSRQYETISDSNGLFQFTEARGVKMGVFPSKPGYEFNRKYAQANWSEDYHPDPSKPVVFTMWKLQGPERIMRVEWSRPVGVKPAEPTGVDLHQMRKSATNVHLIVTYRCSADAREQYVDYKQVPYDWEVTFEIPDGGFVPIANKTYPYEAPDENYRPSLHFEMSRNNPNWTQELNGIYYVKLREGQEYGRIEFTFWSSPKWNCGSFEAVAYINPWGSRNLEYDVDRPFDRTRPALRQ